MVTSRSASATVSLGALAHNLSVLRERAPNSRIMGVVKANAYGHGIAGLAPVLQTADALAVASVDGAVVLRGAGIARPVVVLGGAVSLEELAAADAHRIELVVHSDWQIAALEGFQPNNPLAVWLKVDTGMNRLGFRTEHAQTAWDRLRVLPAVGAIRLMTHLAHADEQGHPGTSLQLERFKTLTRGWPGERSVANSAAVFAWPDTHADWVRPGLSLYGISPFPGTRGAELGLRPVMTLESRLVAIREVMPGESVGYGGDWVAAERCRVGIVGIGYGDGYPRHVGPDTRVLIAGQRCALVGRVSMDMLAVDLTGMPNAQVGDTVVLWGEGLPVEDIAASCGTIPWTLLCGVTERVKLDYTAT